MTTANNSQIDSYSLEIFFENNENEFNFNQLLSTEIESISQPLMINFNTNNMISSQIPFDCSCFAT